MGLGRTSPSLAPRQVAGGGFRGVRPRESVIASVGGIAAPPTPAGSFLVAPDILLPAGTTNPVEVFLTASNIPLGTTIQVTATPQSGARS